MPVAPPSKGGASTLLIAGSPSDLDPVRRHLTGLRPGLPLELRWEIDEVLEAIAPPPEPEPEVTEEEPADKPLSASDLTRSTTTRVG